VYCELCARLLARFARKFVIYCTTAKEQALEALDGSKIFQFGKNGRSPSKEYLSILLSPALFLRTCEAWVRITLLPVLPWFTPGATSSKNSRAGGTSGDGNIQHKVRGKGADSLSQDADSNVGSLLLQHSAVYRLSRHILHIPELSLQSPIFGQICGGGWAV